MNEKELLKKYTDLKSRVEEAQSKADRAEGALSTHMAQLKEQFDCSTLAEAKKELKRLTKSAEAAGVKFQEALEAFEEEWEKEDE